MAGPPSVVSAERLSADERRTALLDVAKVLIAEAGPEAVTVGASPTGRGDPLVYKHFDNKDDLLGRCTGGRAA
jgi:AcrR family transcriptional regulator